MPRPCHWSCTAMPIEPTWACAGSLGHDEPEAADDVLAHARDERVVIADLLLEPFAPILGGRIRQLERAADRARLLMDTLQLAKVLRLGSPDHEAVDFFLAHKRKTPVRRLPYQGFRFGSRGC